MKTKAAKTINLNSLMLFMWLVTVGLYFKPYFMDERLIFHGRSFIFGMSIIFTWNAFKEWRKSRPRKK